MSTDYANSQQLASKSRQITATQEKIDDLKDRIDVLQEDLEDLELLRFSCFEAQEQYVTLTNSFTNRFATLEDIKNHTGAAHGYMSKMDDIVNGEKRTGCINNMEAGITALNLRINNLIATIEAKNITLTQYKSNIANLRYQYENLKRSAG